MTPAAFEPTRLAIQTFLATIVLPFDVEWEGGSPTTPDAQRKAFGRWSIQQGQTQPATIGQGHTRATGVVFLQVFIPDRSPTGLVPALSAADVLATQLDHRQLNTPKVGTAWTQITFRTTGITDAGFSEGYHQKNLSCIFQRDTYS